MDHPAIFSATLGLPPPWHIITVTFAGERRMDISVDVYPGNLFTCPRCGARKAPCCSEDETWYHEDFFRYATYLHAHVPRIECCNGVVAAERPWSRTGSRFSQVASPQDATSSGLADDFPSGPGPFGPGMASRTPEPTRSPSNR